MRTLKYITSGIVIATILLPAAVKADSEITNRFTFSALFGFNISAKFNGLPNAPLNFVNTRTTLDGDAYNYDDGYSLVDSSGNAGGLTWYWGYDNKALQYDSAANPIINGNNTILMHRSAPASDISSPSAESNPSYGAEFAYNCQLGATEKIRYGFEAAASYLNLDISDNSTFTGNSIRTPYENAPDESGTEPPPVSQTSGPWDGRFGPTGSSFLIDANFQPVSPVEIVPGGTVVSGQRQYEANTWGLRLGPYCEFPLGTNFDVGLFAGFAVAWLDGTATWSETVSVGNGAWTATSSGSGSSVGFLYGGYVGANVAWHFAEDWSLVGSARYQNLGNYQHNFSGQNVEVDFSNAIMVNFGVSYSF